MLKVAVLDDYQNVFSQIINLDDYKSKYDFTIGVKSVKDIPCSTAVLPLASPINCWFFLKIPWTLSTVITLEPFLHDVTLALATSVEPDLCTIVSPTSNLVKSDIVSI